MLQQPWITAPSEILEHGLALLKKDSDKNRLLAMLNIDNAVELAIKTYLGLPRDITGINLSLKDYQEISDSFPRLLEALRQHAQKKLSGIDLGTISYFHRVRNDLYHRPTGLTVTRANVEAYAEIAKLLFKNLFDIEVKPEDEESLGLLPMRDASLVRTAELRTWNSWSGFSMVNIGEGQHRNWDDNLRYGYLSAGQGRQWSEPLKKLRVGNRVFAYLKGHGYVGYGIVKQEAIPIKDFRVEKEGKLLLDLPLKSDAWDNKDNPELCEWAVAIDWIKAFPRTQAKTFKGIFTNPHIVCKLQDPRTSEFLKKEFEVSEPP